MKITDHIGIFEKGLPLNVCEAVIQSFNLWEGQREFIAEAFKDGENQFKDGNFSRSDTQLCLEVVDLDLYQTLNGLSRKHLSNTLQYILEYFKIMILFLLGLLKFKKLKQVEDIINGIVRMVSFFIEIEFLHG